MVEEPEIVLENNSIESVINKEVRKIFGELNIYTFGYILLQLKGCLLARYCVIYSIIDKEFYGKFR